MTTMFDILTHFSIFTRGHTHLWCPPGPPPPKIPEICGHFVASHGWERGGWEKKGKEQQQRCAK